MNPIHQLFHEHPEHEGMTYTQHLKRACYLSGKMAYGSLCLLIHAIVPAFCEKTGTRIIQQLHHDISSPKKE
jgi:hypothetical protein